MQGTVKWFSIGKGYGYIIGSDGKENFVHHSSIQMEGFRYLNTDDIVDFEIGNGTTGKEQAVNVQPILTFAMVTNELAKEDLHPIKGKRGWYVADKSDNPVVNKEMDLVELAAYAGFDVEGLKDNQ